MRVLVTRPAEDADETAERLKALGHSAVLSPLLEIRYRGGPEIHLQDVQAVLATSANGVRALAARTQRRDVAVFAVGPQTSQAARDAGFAVVKTANGDADALAKATRGWATPSGGVLLHAAAAETKGNLAQVLSAQGYNVRTETLYEAAALSHLPDLTASALRRNEIDAILFFSPRTVTVFAGLVTAAGLAASCARIIAICISAATAQALAPLQFREIRIAEKPNQDAVFARLG